MTLTLEGRDLTPEEEYRVVPDYYGKTDIEVLCLLDTDDGTGRESVSRR